jgi:hypothetical protein
VARTAADQGSAHDVTMSVERADAEVSLALQQAFFVDIASRYPGWTPESSQGVERMPIGSSESMNGRR